MTLKAWLADEPFALAMSAGFFGFFAHAGFLQVLEDEGLLPERVSGASAGALVGALWASGVNTSALSDELFALRREHFWDPAPGLGLLRGRLFRERVEALLPVRSFEDCRVPAKVSVFDVLSRTTRALGEGELAPAICASCTLPGLFQPAMHHGRPLLDGGIFDRPGLLGLGAHRRVLHHHLASRSPWRRQGGPSTQPPKRPGLISLVIEGLPRVGPFRLERGALAFERARLGARRALARPVRDGVVRVTLAD